MNVFTSYFNELSFGAYLPKIPIFTHNPQFLCLFIILSFKIQIEIFWFHI
jgi:hypothetical protein